MNAGIASASVATIGAISPHLGPNAVSTSGSADAYMPRKIGLTTSMIVRMALRKACASISRSSCIRAKLGKATSFSGGMNRAVTIVTRKIASAYRPT